MAVTRLGKFADPTFVMGPNAFVGFWAAFLKERGTVNRAIMAENLKRRDTAPLVALEGKLRDQWVDLLRAKGQIAEQGYNLMRAQAEGTSRQSDALIRGLLNLQAAGVSGAARVAAAKTSASAGWLNQTAQIRATQDARFDYPAEVRASIAIAEENLGKTLGGATGRDITTRYQNAINSGLASLGPRATSQQRDMFAWDAYTQAQARHGALSEDAAGATDPRVKAALEGQAAGYLAVMDNLRRERFGGLEPGLYAERTYRLLTDADIQHGLATITAFGVGVPPTAELARELAGAMEVVPAAGEERTTSTRAGMSTRGTQRVPDVVVPAEYGVPAAVPGPVNVGAVPAALPAVLAPLSEIINTGTLDKAIGDIERQIAEVAAERQRLQAQPAAPFAGFRRNYLLDNMFVVPDPEVQAAVAQVAAAPPGIRREILDTGARRPGAIRRDIERTDGFPGARQATDINLPLAEEMAGGFYAWIAREANTAARELIRPETVAQGMSRYKAIVEAARAAPAGFHRGWPDLPARLEDTYYVVLQHAYAGTDKWLEEAIGAVDEVATGANYMATNADEDIDLYHARVGSELAARMAQGDASAANKLVAYADQLKALPSALRGGTGDALVRTVESAKQHGDAGRLARDLGVIREHTDDMISQSAGMGYRRAGYVGIEPERPLVGVSRDEMQEVVAAEQQRLARLDAGGAEAGVRGTNAEQVAAVEAQRGTALTAPELAWLHEPQGAVGRQEQTMRRQAVMPTAVPYTIGTPSDLPAVPKVPDVPEVQEWPEPARGAAQYYISPEEFLAVDPTWGALERAEQERRQMWTGPLVPPASAPTPIPPGLSPEDVLGITMPTWREATPTLVPDPTTTSRATPKRPTPKDDIVVVEEEAFRHGVQPDLPQRIVPFGFTQEDEAAFLTVGPTWTELQRVQPALTAPMSAMVPPTPMVRRDPPRWSEWTITPTVPPGLSPEEEEAFRRALLDWPPAPPNGPITRAP